MSPSLEDLVQKPESKGGGWGWLGMDKGTFLIMLALVAFLIIIVTTGSLMILGNIWSMMMKLSTTIPLPLGIVLLIILLVVLRKPKKTYYR